MSNHSKALAFINHLVEKFGKGSYIFRGTTKRYSEEKGVDGILDGINSNLYRWVVKDDKQGEMAGEKENLETIFFGNDSFSPYDMEKEIVDNARKHFPSKTESHEVLTELQHFGGKTNMIDFSRSMYIALFFACQGNLKKNGELIALREEQLQRINKIDYDKRPEKGTLEILNPASAQSSSQRVNFQSSVFVRPADGYINPKLCEINEVPAELKKDISEYLRVLHNITTDTVYNDLHGFIKNEKNNETTYLYFYMGLANQNKHNHKKAIDYYSKCIQINPAPPVLYNNRGNSHSALKDYDHAIADYDKAISIKPDYYEAYYNKGLTCDRAKQYDCAFKCFDKVISLKPSFAEAYYGRGNAHACLGNFKLAISDYNKAMSLKDDYVNAKMFRELAKKMASDGSTGEDFAKWMRKSFFPPREE